MKYLLLKITMHNFHAWHWFIRWYKCLSHGSKGKGTCFVQVPTKWNIYVTFPEFIKWNETTNENYWCYIHSIWMRHMDFRMGVRNWKTKTPKVEKQTNNTNNKSNKQTKNTTSHFPDLRLLSPNQRFCNICSLVTNITNFLSYRFSNIYVYNMLVKRSNDRECPQL